jgi:hypothetical protein
MFPQSLQAMATRLLVFPALLTPQNLQSNASKPRNYPSEHPDGQKSTNTTTSEASSHIHMAAGKAYSPHHRTICEKGTSSTFNHPVTPSSLSLNFGPVYCVEKGIYTETEPARYPGPLSLKTQTPSLNNYHITYKT